MSQDSNKSSTSIFPWTAFFAFLGAVLTAYIGYLSVRFQTEAPIQATQNAEIKLTLVAQSQDTPVPPTITQEYPPTAMQEIPTVATAIPTSIPAPTEIIPPTAIFIPTSNISTYTLTVDANILWQNTDILINSGDRVVVQYISGTWGEYSQDANGDPGGYICAYSMPASRCTELVPDAVQGSLVGKVGTQIFNIGNYLEFTPAQSGTLILTRNDDIVRYRKYGGDVGAIIVQVTVFKSR